LQVQEWLASCLRVFLLRCIRHREQEVAAAAAIMLAAVEVVAWAEAVAAEASDVIEI
jgi:hypothetical protein